jgi:hypothetical protein
VKFLLAVDKVEHLHHPLELISIPEGFLVLEVILVVLFLRQDKFNMPIGTQLVTVPPGGNIGGGSFNFNPNDPLFGTSVTDVNQGYTGGGGFNFNQNPLDLLFGTTVTLPATSGGGSFNWGGYGGPTVKVTPTPLPYDPSPIGGLTPPVYPPIVIPPVVPPTPTPPPKTPSTGSGGGLGGAGGSGGGLPGPNAPVVGGGPTQSLFTLPNTKPKPVPTLLDLLQSLQFGGVRK